MSTMEDKPIYQTKNPVGPEKTERPFYLKSITFIKKFWNVLLITVGYIVSFYLGHSYEKLKVGFNPPVTQFPPTQSRDEISVSVNDRAELVFMNRKKNQINIYSDTIGLIIYDLYSSQLIKK